MTLYKHQEKTSGKNPFKKAFSISFGHGMGILIAVFFMLAGCSQSHSDAEDVQAIRRLMDEQAKAWSNHNLEGFMTAYWESNSVTYFSANGLRKGYDAMLGSYRDRYPTKAETGTLTFTLHDITKISENAYWVMGEYHLDREVGDSDGTFMIVLKRINGEWKIVGDSSC